MAVKTKPLQAPPVSEGGLPLDVAAVGPPVPPIERLRHMSPERWVDFVLEWAHSLESKYARVERCDGAGDMGRDVVAFASDNSEDPWDNYQCKHYDQPLAPAHIWLELGKVVYYTFIGEYSFPRRYAFVAPKGAGIALSKLLRRPDHLRQGLLGAWGRYCQRGITTTKEVVLDEALKGYIERIDFSIFGAVSPLTIIDDHRRTPWHVARFGGGLPSRPDALLPPSTLAPNETNYVRALLDAYEDRLGTSLGGSEDIGDPDLANHFSRSRREFYSAESLREFSRDNVPPGTFDRFLDEVHDGIIDVVQAVHPDAYERVLATVRQAKALQLTANALVARTLQTDRGGMCHQLTNDLRVVWRR